MNKLWLAAVFCVLAGIRADAAALSFNVAPGDARYDPVTGVLVAEGTVTATEDVSVAIAGQPFRLAAMLLGMDIDPVEGTLLAHFGGASGFDLEIPGFLAGEFVSLDLAGALGDDFGVLIGAVELAGALAPEFGEAASFFSLKLNMSSPFDERLFASAFTSSLDGRVIGVAVPTGDPLAMLALFVGLLGAASVATAARRLPAGQHAGRASIH